MILLGAVGYGDVVFPASWRLLGTIEAAVGKLVFGWSTAIFVAAITRIVRNRLPREIKANGGLSRP
jgi:hypothetical protein